MINEEQMYILDKNGQYLASLSKKALQHSATGGVSERQKKTLAVTGKGFGPNKTLLAAKLAATKKCLLPQPPYNPPLPPQHPVRRPSPTNLPPPLPF